MQFLVGRRSFCTGPVLKMFPHVEVVPIDPAQKTLGRIRFGSCLRHSSFYLQVVSSIVVNIWRRDLGIGVWPLKATGCVD
jgi:hypothetical protein